MNAAPAKEPVLIKDSPKSSTRNNESPPKPSSDLSAVGVQIRADTVTSVLLEILRHEPGSSRGSV